MKQRRRSGSPGIPGRYLAERGYQTMSAKKKLIVQIALLFTVNILLVALLTTMPRTRAAVYSWGSRGTMVTKIQTNLKKWGYYKGSVDGVFGTQTSQAVRSFQRKNGLKVDGIVGSRTLAALGLSSGSGSTAAASANSNLYLLARIISAEARGEPYTGQVAVGAVVLNRVEHPSFPNTLSGVIYQNGAFTAIVDGQFDQPISSQAYQAARDALNGWDPSGGAIYYYNPATATSRWIYSRPVITRIGNHIFAK